MILGLKPHSAYKLSTCRWLGSLPQHWRELRQRHVAEMRVSNVDKNSEGGELPVRLCNYVDVYKNFRITAAINFMRATATQQEITRFRLRRGDVLITKDSETWNDIGVPSLVECEATDLVCGYHLAVLRAHASVCTGAFLYWASRADNLGYQYHVEANGVTRYGLSHHAIKSVIIPVPPLDEQCAIVRFLNYADRRIRRYIAAKKKLTALLNEQKQAIIERAVTRGIDPNVRLKPSGVEWLGDIPEHWKVRRNGRAFVQRNDVGYPSLPILEVSLRTGVRIRDFEESNRKQVMSNPAAYKRAATGDLAYNMMRMWQGAVGIAPCDGLVSPAYVVARCVAGDARFFVHLFRTPAYMGQIDQYSRGIVKDRNRLYWEDFKQMPSPSPPPDEQTAIANFIERETAALSRLCDGLQRQIDVMREIRTRLISDVVTGKLDVREEAARLPEEIDEALATEEPIEESADEQTIESAEEEEALA